VLLVLLELFLVGISAAANASALPAASISDTVSPFPDASLLGFDSIKSVCSFSNKTTESLCVRRGVGAISSASCSLASQAVQRKAPEVVFFHSHD
jgi:hypothetical protein